ncbi:MAG: 1-deoxy-D-xylulose-5-phosphate synthase [Propionicimonas sp.]|uniref:1-deoxy-D-xylulose-5-phosphate synthase n=1 Tax=Propionicimonas sp. TaxID=1955623 RepID=UPI002B2203AE|nr:1-deoxy-D-xylulose-5-phosphate synthase [Propionicimonas sp.]MEA4943646.1 1-deoxy-D-xylulose-5-phosphate synthase [Propionicimonas sp.]MEA5118473.1 1-deoxy-D-xylulose-5-phosphate synthase [Propionicimonas sp.]
MSLLEQIEQPSDLRGLSLEQLTTLAEEIRAFLISNVSRTGGHLGPNLGVVELTLAIHRIFDSPHDPIVFDTGHQSYVHKILTGRQAGFPTLRQTAGLSGYPSRTESEHDWVENSHASASLSWAEGMAKAFKLRGEDRCVVAVIGDGALTGGMVWEALNNIAVQRDLKLIVVVNDNGRSYTPTVGGIATQLQGLGQQLTAIRTDRRYERLLTWIKDSVKRMPKIGPMVYGILHGIKMGVRDVLVPQGMFTELGLKYVGPINGHDVHAMELALQQARNFGGPVLVHCITEKGRGFWAAEENEEDRFHTVGKFDELTGESLGEAGVRTWTDAFGDELARIGATNDRVVAVTAAMLHPTGLATFARHFPDRVFDVGIAEQHAVASAAGLSAGGLHPVFAVYATFLNRAFDQVLMDVALHRQGVTFVLDRAGVTGPDGPSHNGMWDLGLLGLVPGLRLAAPRDEQRLCEALQQAVSIDDGPSVLRYSKEPLPEPLAAVARRGDVDILLAQPHARVLVVGYGQFCGTAVDVGQRLAQQGIAATVVDPVWALPVSANLLELVREHDLVATIEDGGVAGGLGSRLSQEARAAGITTLVREFGIPQDFLPQGSRGELLDSIGLTAQQLAREITEAFARQIMTVPVERLS